MFTSLFQADSAGLMAVFDRAADAAAHAEARPALVRAFSSVVPVMPIAQAQRPEEAR